MLLCRNSTTYNSILFAKKLDFKPAKSRGPIKILAFIKFGKNSALFKKVWKRLLGNQ